MTLRAALREPILRAALLLAVMLPGVLGALAPDARAQERIMSGSADLADPSSLFANPALISFHRARVSFGAKAYHIGFSTSQGSAPYRQSFLTLSSPYVLGRRLGAGLVVQSFGSPVFYRTTAGLQAAYRIRRDLALGVEVGAINVSYDQNNFNLVDPNDPVFASGTSKTVPTLSVGAYAQPTEWLGASAGVRTLNAPNLALGAGTARAQRTAFVGAHLRVAPVSLVLDGAYDGRYFNTRAYLGLGSQNGHFVRFSSDLSDAAAARFEGQLRIGGPLLIHYSYDVAPTEFQGVSDGSHRFSITYELTRDRIRIPSRTPSAPLDLTYEPNFEDGLDARVHILAASDYVAVHETEVIRTIDPLLPDAALAALSPADLGLAPDSLYGAMEPGVRGDPVSSSRTGTPFTGSISEDYRASLDALGRAAREGRGDTLEIVSAEPVLNRALGLARRIAPTDNARARVAVQTPRLATAADSARYTQRIRSRADIPPRSTFVRMDPPEARLYIFPAQTDANGDPEQIVTVDWALVVESSAGREVARRSGTGALPGEITWDWRNSDGGALAPGVYRYYLTWTDTDGQTEQTNTRRLFVQKFSRTSTIEVRRDPRGAPTDSDDVKLLIRN